MREEVYTCNERDMRKRGGEEGRDRREVELEEGRDSTPIALLAGVIEDYQNLGLSTVLPPPKDTTLFKTTPSLSALSHKNKDTSLK